MTRKLYYEDAYIRKWETEIVEVVEQADGSYIILAETAFYPEGGGQPSDEGTINGMAVIEVVKQGDKILHKVSGSAKMGKAICELNWDRRFDHMQQHSGQHLLSAVCRQLFDAGTVSFHLGKEIATIDIHIANLDNRQIKLLEQEVNKQLIQNHVIKSYFVTEEELQHIELVKKPAVHSKIRIVETEGIEYNACGGTHVARTGEIGPIKILKSESNKGNTRLYFKCGFRALADYAVAQDTLAALALQFHTSRDEVPDRIMKLAQEKKEVEKQIKALKERLLAVEASELLDQSAHDGIVSSIFEEKSMKEMQQLAVEVTKGNDAAVLFASKKELKVVLMHSRKQYVHCGNLYKEHLGKYNGKGGGSEQSAQAGFADLKDMIDFYEHIGKVIHDSGNNED